MYLTKRLLYCWRGEGVQIKSAENSLIIAGSINAYARKADESSQLKNMLLHRKIIIALSKWKNWTPCRQGCGRCFDDDEHHVTPQSPPNPAENEARRCECFTYNGDHVSLENTPWTYVSTGPAWPILFQSEDADNQEQESVACHGIRPPQPHSRCKTWWYPYMILLFAYNHTWSSVEQLERKIDIFDSRNTNPTLVIHHWYTSPTQGSKPYEEWNI